MGWQRHGRGQPSPEYGPMGLLMLLPVDDTGEQPEGLRTCRKSIGWRRWPQLRASRKLWPALRKTMCHLRPHSISAFPGQSPNHPRLTDSLEERERPLMKTFRNFLEKCTSGSSGVESSERQAGGRG